MWEQTSLLPKLIVIWMVDELLPEKIIVVIFFSCVFQRSNLEVKIITVFWRLAVKPLDLIVIPTFGGRLFMLIAKHGKGSEVTLQKRTLMMKVVKEKIADRRLW